MDRIVGAAAVVAMHRVLRVRAAVASVTVRAPVIAQVNAMETVLHQVQAAPRLQAVVHPAALSTPATRRAAHARQVRVVVRGMVAHDAAVD